MFKVGSFWVWVSDSCGTATIERISQNGSRKIAATVWSNSGDFKVGNILEVEGNPYFCDKNWKPYSELYGLLLGLDCGKIG